MKLLGLRSILKFGVEVLLARVFVRLLCLRAN